MEQFTLPTTREEWLAMRMQGIGASESSACIGLNPYMSNQKLYRLKVGIEKAEDIGDKPCVKYGHDAESPIRRLFALDYAHKYKVAYLGEFDMVRNSKHPFIFSTLDGRLVEKETGRLGIYEGKTTEILRSQQLEKWTWKDDDGKIHGRVPDNYYTQILHQMLSFEKADFAVLNCQFKRVFGGGDDIKTETKRYFFERSELQQDLDLLLDAELKFWECVQSGKEPDLILPQI